MTPAEAQAPGARVLVVEDSETMATMLSSIITLDRHEPLMAYDGQSALRMVAEDGPDLVLLDVGLPDMEGLEVCRRIKEDTRGGFLPVILLTARARRDDRLSGLFAGADDYIVKPFDAEELLAKVRVMLRIKRAEEALLRRNAELAAVNAENARLIQDERRTVQKLTELDALKSQFISMASHEFRTPLSVIKGFANLLKRREDFGFDRGTEVEYLEVIDMQIQSLTQLIDNMLNVSRIESGEVRAHPHHLDLAALVRRLVALMEVQAAPRGMTLTIERLDPLVAFADAQLVEQVMLNLLSNALKYSDDGTTVTVRVQRHEHRALVSIQDEGVGIAPEDVPHLFEKFRRLENPRTVEAGGTGLGLYIARHWIEASGGTLWAESVPGEGSAFRFTLPLAEP